MFLPRLGMGAEMDFLFQVAAVMSLCGICIGIGSLDSSLKRIADYLQDIARKP